LLKPASLSLSQDTDLLPTSRPTGVTREAEAVLPDHSRPHYRRRRHVFCYSGREAEKTGQKASANVRILIAADIHANLEAFQAVLRHVERSGPIDRLWCPGDIVGYGPDPNACIALVRQYPHLAVAGNHDFAAAGKIATPDFNPAAAEAAAWTAARLTYEERKYLEQLPEIAYEDDFTLVHGSLRAPIWEYVLTMPAMEAHFRLMETPFSVIGHSHVAFLAEEGNDGKVWMSAWQDGETVDLPASRLIISPGGVGQPRDGDPRAAYAAYDSDARTLTLHRVEYDIPTTQAKIRAAGLPASLADRLSFGQ
jgi:diadenosine tetraphosphatase ApaH/serine/threonine PP2A family protein phosphatase